MTDRKWTFLARPYKGGQQFFKDEQGRIAICDNSGKDPDHTEDGPLFLDSTRMIELGESCGSIVAMVPVTVENDNHSESRVGCMDEALYWMLLNHITEPEMIETSEKLRVLFKIFGILDRSSSAPIGSSA